MKIRRSALLALAAAGLLPRLAPAQATRPPAANGLAPVTVALVDTMQAVYAFVRRPGHGDERMILVCARVDARTLTAALSDYAAVRTQLGEGPWAPGREVRLPPPPARPYPWAADVVARLHAAEPVAVDGIGSVRAVELWLPAPTSRAGAPRRPRFEPYAPPGGGATIL